MTYEDAIQWTVTASQAKREIEKHGCEWSEFVQDCGDKATYSGKTVLDWLGY